MVNSGVFFCDHWNLRIRRKPSIHEIWDGEKIASGNDGNGCFLSMVNDDYPLVNEHNYGKSPFLMGKSTISMAMFNSYVIVYQRVMVIFWATIYVRSSMRYQKLAQGWLNDPENINTVKSIYVYVCYVYLSGGANQSMNSENGMIHPPPKKKNVPLYTG